MHVYMYIHIFGARCDSHVITFKKVSVKTNVATDEGNDGNVI